MAANYPPGPRDGLFGLTLYGSVTTDPLGFAVRVAREYGDFAFVRVGWVRLYLVNRPELVREMLTTKVNSFRKVTKHMRALRKIEGDGLVVAEGETWARHRPVVQGSFHARHMRGYARLVVEHTLRRLSRWTPEQPFDLAADMNELALEIVARVVFGVDVAERAARLRDAVHVARAAMQLELSRPFVRPDWLPTPGKLRQRRALRTIDQLIWDLIRERRASGVAREDMLGQMLAAAARMAIASPITDAEIRDEAATLFVAGHDTTSASLAWLWCALAQNPMVEHRIVRELQEGLGGRTPTFEDLPRLKYLEMTVKETMRFYPASAFLFWREALEDVELDGHTLRRGAWAVISPYIVQHDAKNYPDPERFDPERFSPERIHKIPPYAYLPFGGGPGICIGSAFATMEMVLVAATILQKYHMQMDQAPPAIELEVVIRPRGGLRMIAIPREDAGRKHVAA